jgi:hypothetical protein
MKIDEEAARKEYAKMLIAAAAATEIRRNAYCWRVSTRPIIAAVPQINVETISPAASEVSEP